jgi:hypothetical protein
MQLHSRACVHTQDFCKTAWAYSLWLLVKRLFLSIALNAFDGSANAILALVIQSVDTGLLLLLRPFINRQTELSESVGSITNLLVTLLEPVQCSLFHAPRSHLLTYTHFFRATWRYLLP